jgi:hypothetical protein
MEVCKTKNKRKNVLQIMHYYLYIGDIHTDNDIFYNCKNVNDPV